MTDPAAHVIRRYAQAGADDDLDTMESLHHPDWQEAWPQTGEIVPNSATYRTLRMGRPEGAPIVRPIREGGSGDCWWGEMEITYGDGSRWLGITIFELRDGLIHRERVYFAQPLPAPAWRAPYVIQEPPALS